MAQDDVIGGSGHGHSHEHGHSHGHSHNALDLEYTPPVTSTSGSP
jgi:hypothetical protein